MARTTAAGGGDAGGGVFALLDVAREVVRREGPLGFMRGWTASYARIGPTMFIQLPIVEAVRRSSGVTSI